MTKHLTNTDRVIILLSIFFIGLGVGSAVGAYIAVNQYKKTCELVGWSNTKWYECDL